MGYETVAALDADTTISLGKKNKTTGKADPTQIEGYYLGKRVTTGGKYGDSTLHIFQTASGNVGVWGTTDLNNKLEAVPVGSMTRATATGTRPTKNGDMRTYKVEVDSSNKIEVITTEVSAADTAVDQYGGGPADDHQGDYLSLGNDNGEALTNRIAAEQEVAKRAAAAAKVQDLLNKNRRTANK